MSHVLNAAVVNSLVGRAFSRAIWIDVETVGTSDGTVITQTFNLVIRGEDKVKSGAGESTATSDADKKEHKPALIWNDSASVNIPYSIASFPDKLSAEVCAEQLLQFYTDAGEDIAFTDRYEALGSDARAILPAILSVFGVRPNSEMMRAGRICSFAEYESGSWRKRQPKKADPAAALKAIAAVLRESKAGASDDASAAAVLGVSVEVYKQLKAVLSA